MGLPHKFLGTDETEVLHLRTHAKALIAPAVVFLLSATAAGFLVALTPPEWQPAAGIVEFVLVVLVFLTWVVWPFLRWLTTTYTLTTRRIISRRGIINQTGHDLPLSRINNVAYERSLTDRILGCGTLVLTTAAEEPVTLSDIPDIERVHVVMTELLFGTEHQPAVEPPDRDE
ncbi:MAG: PH domain-containing protein [Propionibacteriaceae bacterium]|nr:PH domain-containing protein [Propionibacteriaceae bacterium]